MMTLLYADRSYYPDDLVDGWMTGWGALNQFIHGSWYAYLRSRHTGQDAVTFVDGHIESRPHAWYGNYDSPFNANSAWGEW